MIEALGGDKSPPKSQSNVITSPRLAAVKQIERMKAAYQGADYTEEYKKIVPSAKPSWWSKGPSEQLQAVKAYTGSTYSSVNDALRDNNPENISPHIIETINNIDAAFDNPGAEATADFVVRRGMDLPAEQKEVFLNKLKKGLQLGLPVRFDQQGFISTSTAHGFSNNIRLHVLVKKGTPALHLSGQGVSVQGPAEHECLLRHGQPFEALSYEYKNGEHHITVATV